MKKALVFMCVALLGCADGHADGRGWKQIDPSTLPQECKVVSYAHTGYFTAYVTCADGRVFTKEG